MMKKVVVLMTLVLGILALNACKTSHTCPTYLKSGKISSDVSASVATDKSYN
jgi:hypothetical protein